MATVTFIKWIATTDISWRHVRACIFFRACRYFEFEESNWFDWERIETRDRYVGSMPIIYYLMHRWIMLALVIVNTNISLNWTHTPRGLDATHCWGLCHARAPRLLKDQLGRMCTSWYHGRSDCSECILCSSNQGHRCGKDMEKTKALRFVFLFQVVFFGAQKYHSQKIRKVFFLCVWVHVCFAWSREFKPGGKRPGKQYASTFKGVPT